MPGIELHFYFNNIHQILFLLLQKMVNTGKGTGVPDPGNQNITDTQEMTFQIQPVSLSFCGLICEPRKERQRSQRSHSYIMARLYPRTSGGLRAP